MLKELVNSNDDRHLKIQKDRLLDEFAAAVSAFQAVQKKTVDIEKSQYRQARSQNVAIPKPPGSSGNNSNKGSFFMDTFSAPQQSGQMQSQLQEDIDLQALEEQERTIRELEVGSNFEMQSMMELLNFLFFHSKFAGKHCRCQWNL